MRFSKHNRLLKSTQFDAVFQSGTKVVSPHFVVVGAQNDAHARVGLVVSRKVGSAVTRNRVKRWIRESFRQSLVNECSLDLVVIARHCSGDIGFRKVQYELQQNVIRLSRKFAQSHPTNA